MSHDTLTFMHSVLWLNNDSIPPHTHICFYTTCTDVVMFLTQQTYKQVNMFSGGFTAKISFDSLKPVGGFSVTRTAPTSNNNTNTNNYNIIIIIRTANTALKPCVSMICTELKTCIKTIMNKIFASVLKLSG